MKGKIFLLVAAIVVAAILVSTSVIANNANTQNYYDNDDNDDMKTNETAGGGGWYDEEGEKNTFGFYLNVNDYNNSSMVFHARYAEMKIHAINFTDIFIEDDDGDGNWTAHAFGSAKVNKICNYTFHLEVTDVGKGRMDLLDLWVDSDTESYHWMVEGLGGGNIWIEP